MARAAALAQIEDLPEDMRRLTDTMLAEARGASRARPGGAGPRRAHPRSLAALAGAGLGGVGAGSAGGKTPRIRCLARGRRGASGGGPGACSEAEGEAARRVAARPPPCHAGRARRPGGGRRGCWSARGSSTMPPASSAPGTRFANARRRPAYPELYAPGYRQVAALWRKARWRPRGSTRDAQLMVAEWREIDAAQAALAEEVRALPGRIAAWRERHADLTQDEPGGLDPDPSHAAVLARGRRRAGRPGPRTCCDPDDARASPIWML